jgi:hypothetical protein
MDANHKVNSKGGIEFPVFHRNHRCIRGSSSFNKMNDEIPMDIIDDSSINPSIFLMPINRGTPRVMNLVAFDKGSTLSWIQCQPCTVKCHNQSNKAGPIFDPRKSSSFRNVRCKSLECLHIHNTLQLPVNCMEKEDICTYGITYGGGSVSSVGTVARDSVRIGRDGSNVLTIDLLFGCSEDTNYDYFEAGIIGFGSSIFSFSEQVSSRMGSYKAFKW